MSGVEWFLVFTGAMNLVSALVLLRRAARFARIEGTLDEVAAVGAETARLNAAQAVETAAFCTNANKRFALHDRALEILRRQVASLDRRGG